MQIVMYLGHHTNIHMTGITFSSSLGRIENMGGNSAGWLSIITIVKDDQRGLDATLSSVRHQTMQPYEHVIVDGGETVLCLNHATNPRTLLRVVRDSGTGIANAFNVGAEHANGQYLLYLNAGDTLNDENTLETCASLIDLKRYSETVVYYGNYKHWIGGREELAYTGTADIWKRNTLNHQSCFIPRKLQLANLYDCRLAISMDYNLWLQCLSQGVQLKHINCTVARFQSDGVSSIDSMLMHNLATKFAVQVINSKCKYQYKDIVRFFAFATKRRLGVFFRTIVGKKTYFLIKGTLRTMRR